MDALHQNLERVREAADGRDVWAVVKANAYGHGLSNAVKAFAEADGLATIDICDAAKARACGWTKRILLLEGFSSRTTSGTWKSTTLKRSCTRSG